MRPFRNLKVASVLQDELGKLLARDFNFDGALVTVTEVTISDDLLHAQVKLGIIPYEKGPEAYKRVTRMASDIRFALLKKMNIKPMPFLKFEIDEPDKKNTEEV